MSIHNISTVEWVMAIMLLVAVGLVCLRMKTPAWFNAALMLFVFSVFLLMAGGTGAVQ